MLDLIIKNGRIITPTEIVNGALAILKGKIVKLGNEADFDDANLVIDAKENWVLPGLIDPHVLIIGILKNHTNLTVHLCPWYFTDFSAAYIN